MIMKKFKALIEIPCEDAEIIKKSLEVEKNEDFLVEIEMKGNSLIIEIEADKISMLQAGINSYLRALKALI